MITLHAKTMSATTILACTVFIPLAGALLLPLAGRVSEGLRNGAALSFVLASLAGSLLLLGPAATGRIPQFTIAFPLGWSFRLAADGPAAFTAVMASLVGAIILLYSFDYIRRYDHRQEYYFMVVLFLGAMMGLVYSRSLLFLYVFWEITAIASWRLIGFYRAPADVGRANKAFLVTFLGALLMLAAIVTVYGRAGTFDLDRLRGLPLTGALAPLLLAGILSKSATLPFHTWLPDAGVAPSPVTALLHAAVLVKIGVYAFARLFLFTFAAPPFWNGVVLWLAAASALVSAGAALVDTDLKRIIAYSTVSQIAFILLGLASGTPVGVVGGLLFILMHGFAKGGLFLAAGIVEQRTHIRDINRLGGLARTMPFTAAAFLLCAFSVMGVPPFGGFFGKYLVLSAAVNAGRADIGLVFLLGALLTVVYLFRLYVRVFLGDYRGAGHEVVAGPAREGSVLMVACVCLLAFLSLAGGILVRAPAAYLAGAVRLVVGGTP